MRGKVVAAAVVLAWVCGARAWAQGQAQAEKKAKPSEINKPFANPNVKEFVKRFESESREVYAQREAIVQAAGVKPGMDVADIGAGTGVFTRVLADRVGPEGKVYAVDIAPAFLKHIAAEAKKRGHEQVRTIQGNQQSTRLERNSIDLAIMVDVYHHLEHHQKVLASIHQALRPGGKLVIVEFDRTPSSSEFIRNHIRADKGTFLGEITADGFEQVATPDAPRLKENFFAAFRKTTAAGDGTSPTRPGR